MKYSLQNIPSLFLLTIALAMSSGCGEPTLCCTHVDLDVQIHYVNSDGENLLEDNPEFNESQIKIYYLNGDEFEYAYNGNLDYPGMYYVYDNSDDKKILTVFASDKHHNNRTTTLIQLNNTTSDTLVCEFDLEVSSTSITRAWLNGVEMNNRYLEVAK